MIRSYRDSDYEQVRELYRHTEWYGGVFSEQRDGREVLARKIKQDPQAILVYEQDSEVIGTISIIEDGRVAWLYRFVVRDLSLNVSKELYDKALGVLRDRGHQEVLVYSATNDEVLDSYYQALGMIKGGTYACFWAKI
jgi:hypothetical protein